MRKTLLSRLFVVLALLPAAAAAQECVEVSNDAAAVLTRELLAARSFRAGEAPVAFTDQKATLAEILRRVSRRQRERKEDPSLPKYVVMIDLDNTTFIPTKRVHAGLDRIASQYGIVEVAAPARDSLELLPHYSKPGFLAWAEKTGLRAQYPNLDWNKVYNSFNGASWNGALDGTETLVPGAKEFARRVSQSGGVVVYNTARREAQREVTIATLKANGIPNPKVTMKPNSGFSGSSAEWKVVAAQNIRDTWGEPLALIDETAINREHMVAEFPDVMPVAISIPGFTTEMSDDELAAETWKISTYER